MWLNVHGDEFVWDEFVGDELFGDESSRIPLQHIKVSLKFDHDLANLSH